MTWGARLAYESLTYLPPRNPGELIRDYLTRAKADVRTVTVAELWARFPGTMAWLDAYPAGNPDRLDLIHCDDAAERARMYRPPLDRDKFPAATTLIKRLAWGDDLNTATAAAYDASRERFGTVMRVCPPPVLSVPAVRRASA